MKILFVVQRYGADVAGGAEALCRMFAERLAGRGHDVSVLTSRALDYDTWADHYPEGLDVVGGVHVHRVGVAASRDPSRFAELSRRLTSSTRPHPALQDAWMTEQGPRLTALGDHVRRLADGADVVVFFTYLYATTVHGVREARGVAPVVVHAAAHDEWPLRIPLMRSVFDHADAVAFSTPEELDLVRRRFRPEGRCEVIGIGFDEPPAVVLTTDDFRARFGLGDRDYVLCLGRIDPNKGVPEAISFVQEYRRRHRSDLALVLCGAPMMDLPDTDGLVVTGFVDDDTRWAALRGASVLVQPSRQESFGMTLAESWLVGTPVLVQEACEVTSGLVRRSGGGLTYGGYTSFDAALGVLLERPELGASLAAGAGTFVRETYSWDRVVGDYEALLDRVSSRRRSASAR